MRLNQFFVLFLLLCPLWGMAQGFQVNLQGQKQTAMGHTGTGLATDAASIFFNPGAVSMLPHNSVSVGISPIISKTSYLAPQPGTNGAAPGEYYQTETDNPVGTPFTLYGAWGPSEKRYKVGLGVYTPFGSSVTWGDDWAGSLALQEISLRSFFIQPTISYRITDNLSIGAGFVYALGTVNLQRAFPYTDQSGNRGKIELDGNANGIGFNAGVFYQPADLFSVGISYRSQVDVKVDGGDASFTGIPASLQANFPAGTQFDTELPLPQVANLGIGLYPTDKLTLALDVNFVGWSAYDSLIFDFDRPSVPDSKAGRRYEDNWIFRLGGQYAVTEKLHARAGGYYAITPVQDGYLTPETPDANRFGISAGLGYAFGEHLVVDASFLFLDVQKRTDINRETGFGGTFKTYAYIPGISFSYNF